MWYQMADTGRNANSRALDKTAYEGRPYWPAPAWVARKPYRCQAKSLTYKAGTTSPGTQKIWRVRAEFSSKTRVSCAKCHNNSRQMRSIFSSICDLEKSRPIGLFEIENRARNGIRGTRSAEFGEGRGRYSFSPRFRNDTNPPLRRGGNHSFDGECVAFPTSDFESMKGTRNARRS